VRAVRFLTVVVALSVALLYAVEAQAERPRPEPPSGTSSRPLRPDPVPSAQPAPPSSTASHYSGPSSASSGSSAPAGVTPSTQATPTPATGGRAHPPAAKPPAAQQKRDRAAAARRASAFLSSLTSFLAKETKFPTGVAVPRSTSSTSTLLLVGAFALVVLALGDAMFLTFIGRQVGIRPRRRQREPRPVAYWDADGPIRRVPLER
jgi:hypothetical protein